MITTSMRRDDAATWCRDNVNGSLAYPASEAEQNVSCTYTEIGNANIMCAL